MPSGNSIVNNNHVNDLSISTEKEDRPGVSKLDNISISFKLNDNVEVVICERTSSMGVRSMSVYKYYMQNNKQERELENGVEVYNDEDEDEDEDDNEEEEEDEFSDQNKIDNLIDDIRLQALKVMTLCLIFLIVGVITGYNILHYVL